MCQCPTPEYRPYMIVCCLGCCSQNMALRLSPAEFPGVPFRGQIPWPPSRLPASAAARRGISRSGLLPGTPNGFLRTLKFKKHCPRCTLLFRGHVGLDADESKALPLSSMSLNKTLSFLHLGCRICLFLPFNAHEGASSVFTQAKDLQCFYFKLLHTSLLPKLIVWPSETSSISHVAGLGFGIIIIEIRKNLPSL